MKPYCTPLSRESVETIALESVDILEACPEIASKSDFVKEQIASAFSDPRLPDVFEDKRQLSNFMFYRVGVPTSAIAEHCEVDPAEVSSCRKQICVQIALVFYQQYIQEALQSLLIPYCQTHEPKAKHWGACSIFYWDDQWGRAFYYFWKNNIEKDDDDIFCEQILPYLPEKWRLSYKPQKTASVCPHLWQDMTDDEIVSVLISFDKPIDPAKQRWGLGSLAKWVDPKTRNMYGKSFWHYWRSKVEAGDESIFSERLLPKFPESWQGNFEHKDFFNWPKMSHKEMADMLETAHKPFGVKKWGLGSVLKWTFAGGRACTAFVQYWRRSVEGSGEDAVFRREILPLLSDTLQKTYRPAGYRMALSAGDDGGAGRVVGIDDPDLLYELADKGSLAAFQKLKIILIFHVTSTLVDLDMDMDILDRVIERAIHMHLPFFGSIKTYAVSCIKNFFLNLRCSSPLVLTGDHPVPYLRRLSGLLSNKVESTTIGTIDFQRTIRHLHDELVKQGSAENLILRLFDLLIDGASLDEIVSSDGSTEYEVDDDVVRVAIALNAIISNQSDSVSW